MIVQGHVLEHKLLRARSNNLLKNVGWVKGGFGESIALIEDRFLRFTMICVYKFGHRQLHQVRNVTRVRISAPVLCI